MMTQRKRFKFGDKVAVPWGLGKIVGDVVEVYGPPARPSVIVRVPTRGPSGETLEESEISFSADVLQIVETA